MARMELTDQKHSSDSIANEQEVIGCTEKTAQLFELDEQNTRAYKALSGNAQFSGLVDFYKQNARVFSLHT